MSVRCVQRGKGRPNFILDSKHRGGEGAPSSVFALDFPRKQNPKEGRESASQDPNPTG